jgi:hypothetical protein
MTSLFRFAFCLLLLQGFNFGDDESARKQAEEEAAQFILETEYALTDYYMTVELTAESSPDAPLVFTSKGIMQKLICDQGVLELCSWKPRILVDDRPEQEKGVVKPFSTGQSSEILTLDGKRYRTRDELFKPCDPIFIDGVKRTDLRWFRCIDLFDWPIHSAGSYSHPTGESKLASIVFGKKKTCFKATQLNSRTIESSWANRVKAGGFKNYTFRDGRPVKFEWVVTNKPFDLKDGVPDRSKGKSVDVVETKWKQQGDTYVPSVVHLVTSLNPWKDSSIIDVVANISVFEKDSKEYKEKKKELETIIAKIPKAKVE